MSETWQADVAAAMAVARELGLTDVEPIVLHVSGRTSVRLAARGAPTVRPTRDPPPGPYIVGGATVTLWTLVEHRKAKGRADALAAGRALAALHAGLADLPERLPPFTQDFDQCAAGLADPTLLRTLADDDRAFLTGRLEDLRAGLVLDPSRFIPLHADAHLGNVFMTPAGAVWADLESVCSGPLEWDLTTLPHAAQAAFPALDRPLFHRLSQLRSVIVCFWCAYHAERSPELRKAGAYHLGRLRRLSGAG